MAEPLDPDREMFAGEFAIGLLEGDDRVQAMRLMLSDPQFAAAVDLWRARLGPLYDGFADRDPPDLWPGIERRIGVGHGDTSRRLAFWRWAAIGSGALAASFAAAFLFARPEPVTIVREVVRAPDQVAVAQLGGSAGALLAANYEPGRGDLRVRAIAIPSSSRVPELWVIPADGVPRSLGLLDGQGVTRVTVPARLRALLVDGATLAVTMELAEGAPHQAPSGTPIATGKISSI